MLTGSCLYSQVVQENKGTTPGLKRTLSEGYENNEQTIKRELKRPKVESEELEAQLELKITAKAGTHHKLEKVCVQQTCFTEMSSSLTEHALLIKDTEHFITFPLVTLRLCSSSWING